MDIDFFQREEILMFIESTLISIAILGVLVIEIYYTLKLSKYLKTKIDESKHSQLKDLSIGSVKLIKGGHKKIILKKLIEIITFIVFIFDIYISLVFILYVFPGTESIVDSMLEFTIQPLKGIGNSIVRGIKWQESQV